LNAKCYDMNFLRLAGATIILPTVALANAETFQASVRRDKVLKCNNINKILPQMNVDIKISFREKRSATSNRA